MKKIILFISVVIAFSFSACDSYFNVEPTGSVPVEDFSSQLNNLRISLNAVYNLMQSEDYQYSELIFGECMSDNSYTTQDNDGSELSQLLNFQFNTENSYILKRYQVNYRGINLANQVISAVPNVNYDPNYTTGAQEIRYVLGQAKLLRALFYFNLVRTFGGVTIQPEVSQLSKTVIPRSTADEIYAYIERDLREACLILYRDRYKKDNAGQAGIGAGLGLLIKVLAYQASPGTALENPNREAKWEEAKEICELFIDGQAMSYEKMLKFSSRYENETFEELCKRLALTDQNPTLATQLPGSIANIHALVDYNGLFRLSGDFGSESLLEINHFDFTSAGAGETLNEKNQLYKCFNANTDHDIGVVPTQAIYDYRNTDPRGIYISTSQSDYSSDFFLDENGEKAELKWFNTAYGYAYAKYMVYPSEGKVEERSYRVMRYAEVLLWYAEILNETGNQVKATEMANRVRNRAKNLLNASNPNSRFLNHITTFDLYQVMPYEEVKKNIQNERRVELAAELDRWYDMQRSGLLAESMVYLASKNGEAADKNSGKPRWRGTYFKRGVNEIMPIPQREITISNGVITQNFGY